MTETRTVLKAGAVEILKGTTTAWTVSKDSEGFEGFCIEFVDGSRWQLGNSS